MYPRGWGAAVSEVRLKNKNKDKSENTVLRENKSNRKFKSCVGWPKHFRIRNSVYEK